MAKFLSNTVGVLFGRIPYVIRVKPAQTGASFMREYKHCRDGEEGECGSCANSLAGQDAGIAPLCISLDSRFIGIEGFKRTKKGILGVGTIWRSEQGKFQRRFDQDKAALLASPQAVGEVKLYPYPKKQSKKGATSKPGQLGTKPGKNSRTLRIPGNKKGAMRRAKRSGILP